MPDDNEEKHKKGRRRQNPESVAPNRERPASYIARMKDRSLERIAVFAPKTGIDAIEQLAQQLRIAAGVTLKKDTE